METKTLAERRQEYRIERFITKYINQRGGPWHHISIGTDEVVREVQNEFHISKSTAMGIAFRVLSLMVASEG